MKLYTIFSPSHKEIYEDFFLKTIPNEFEIITTEIEQDCPTGEFYQEGWDRTCFLKVELFIKACEENMGNHFVFSDVDIQFFGNVKEVLLQEIGDYDIACQNDTGPYYCSGFFICMANERTLNLFREMKKNYVKEDQTTLNNNIHLVKSKFLSHRFFTVGHSIGRPWTGQAFQMPADLLVHHANYTVGVPNKILLLKTVRQAIEGR